MNIPKRLEDIPAKDLAAITSGVNAVLLTRTYAETMRGEVDKIQRAILEEIPINCKPEYRERGRPEKITYPKLTYLGEDAECEDYFAECDKREREAKLKPANMPKEHCPALVAEDVLLKAKWALVECAQPVFGVTVEQATRTVEGFKQYIDLLCGLIVNLPDFKNPLTGKG